MPLATNLIPLRIPCYSESFINVRRELRCIGIERKGNGSNSHLIQEHVDKTIVSLGIHNSKTQACYYLSN